MWVECAAGWSRALRPWCGRPLGLRGLHLSPPLGKTVAGRYKVTVNRTKPLTYEMSFKPEAIMHQKGFNSFNTAQLENTFLKKEEIGQDLPTKMLLEDKFIRQFMHGTWPEALESMVIIKRQHNLIRLAAIISRNRIPPAKVYFLIGYTEELLSFWLKCPVRLELQSGEREDVIYKYI
eukprot:snap_masked-scaffold450_size166944-processed-gene-0.11 protein:Tk00127 transcript:snap_masked-scaffold450_size166944-processed-gene-0.11-mRNA-1 annotation:"28s ribosomal protein mitochondrial precursor"